MLLNFQFRSKDKTITTFQGRRQVILNSGVSLFVAVVFSTVILSALNDSHRNFLIFGISLSPVIIFSVFCLLKSFRVSILNLYEDRAVYRMLFRTMEFPRSQILHCGVESKLRGVTRLWQPYLVLKNGKKVFLSDLATGYRSGIGVPDQYGEWTASLVTTLTAWITDSRHD